jgi:hypothetical protein
MHRRNLAESSSSNNSENFSVTRKARMINNFFSVQPPKQRNAIKLSDHEKSSAQFSNARAKEIVGHISRALEILQKGLVDNADNKDDLDSLQSTLKNLIDQVTVMAKQAPAQPSVSL